MFAVLHTGVPTRNGFTFIEVLVAMLIFVLAVLAAVNIANGSVRATHEAKEMTTAAWLLQNVMVELETKLETDGLDKGCEKKKDAKFEPPYEKYSWTTMCYAIDLKLSQTAAQVTKDKDKSESAVISENIAQKMILDVASDYISKSMRELHAEVSWLQGKTKRTVDLTTHYVRLDQPLSIPAFGVGGTK